MDALILKDVSHIGQAMSYARQFLLSEPAGRRFSVPGVVVIVTDEKSTDDLSQPSAAVRADGEPYNTNLILHTSSQPAQLLCPMCISVQYVSNAILLSLRCDSVGGRNWTCGPRRAAFGSD